MFKAIHLMLSVCFLTTPHYTVQYPVVQLQTEYDN